MYRPGAGTGRQTRYQGIGNQPPTNKQRMDAHEHLRSQMDNGSAQRMQVFSDHITNAIVDEESAIQVYNNLLDELQGLRIPSPEWIKLSGVLTNILNQDRQHKALLIRLQAQLSYPG